MKEQLRAVWEGIKQLPYKWQWALLMFSSMLLFSWWDELIIWGVAIGWKWLIAPIYYGFEYGVLVPLTIWLGVKTYRKMGLELNIGQLAKQSIMNSLPMLIWRGLKKWIARGRVDLDYEKEKTALIGKLIGFVAEFIESHETTEWCHELPEGGEETIEAYLIPKQESDELRAAMKSFLEASV